MELQNERKVYQSNELMEAHVGNNPFPLFTQWFDAFRALQTDDATAMTLATAGQKGPSARIVLLKNYSTEGFEFFTQYTSIKGQDIDKDPRVSLLFFWRELERQVSIQGTAVRLTEQENDEYFYSRPIESQAGAMASHQSHPVASREALLDSYTNLLEGCIERGRGIRPASWGGYRIVPTAFEFWQGRPGRLHDRLYYTLSEDNTWSFIRLAP